MTETDLITAGGSSENEQLPSPVNSDSSTPAADEASNSTPTAETAPTADVASGDRAGSLSTMVLPELRALAKQIGVEGASGMRKGELVTAIRERRGEANGATIESGRRLWRRRHRSLPPTLRPLPTRRPRPASRPASSSAHAASVAAPPVSRVPQVAPTSPHRAAARRPRPTPRSSPPSSSAASPTTSPTATTSRAVSRTATTGTTRTKPEQPERQPEQPERRRRR